jgi:hypothetical protein
MEESWSLYVTVSICWNQGLSLCQAQFEQIMMWRLSTSRRHLRLQLSLLLHLLLLAHVPSLVVQQGSAVGSSLLRTILSAGVEAQKHT